MTQEEREEKRRKRTKTMAEIRKARGTILRAELTPTQKARLEYLYDKAFAFVEICYQLDIKPRWDWYKEGKKKETLKGAFNDEI